MTKKFEEKSVRGKIEDVVKSDDNLLLDKIIAEIVQAHADNKVDFEKAKQANDSNKMYHLNGRAWGLWDAKAIVEKFKK